jgi:hypothetical protein
VFDAPPARVGRYDTVGLEPLAAGRCLSAGQRALAATAACVAPAAHWQVIDTEFGYDLRRDHLVVARFWIHAKAAEL